MRSIFGLLMLIGIVAVFLTGCGGGGGSSSDKSVSDDPASISELLDPTIPAKWTILVYMDGDNDLEPYVLSNMNQMETVGSSKNVKVVCQVDRTPGYSSADGDWTDTRRYIITRDNDIANISSYRLDKDAPLGELNMADPQTLKDFVSWGIQRFPAEHYCVILWNHGSGWEFSTNIGSAYHANAISNDDTSDEAMNIVDIPNALGNTKPDIIAFDACYMQQIEIAYELRNAAKYMVGSAGPEPSTGFSYGRFLSRISGSSEAVDVGKALVDSYSEEYAGFGVSTLSLIDLSQMNNVASACNKFASIVLMNRLTWTPYINSAYTATPDYSLLTTAKQRYLIDPVFFADTCADKVGVSLATYAANLKSAIQLAVIHETHSSSIQSSCGLSIYLPVNHLYDTDYQYLSFAKDTYWDSLAAALAQ